MAKALAKPARALGREAGMRSALALLIRLERDSTFALACDPGWEGAEGKPMRDILWEYLEPRLESGDRDWIKGFCEVLTGFLGISGGGSVPDGKYLKEIFSRRLTIERAAVAAKADTRFQRFISAAQAVQ